MELNTKVGLTVFLIKWGKILLGKQKDETGNGEWQCPGGYLEGMRGESAEDGMKRWALEETGIQLDSVVIGPHTEEFFEKEWYYYINIAGIAQVSDADEPLVMEPEKCVRWEWFAWDNLPERHSHELDQFKSIGFNPVDYLE